MNHIISGEEIIVAAVVRVSVRVDHVGDVTGGHAMLGQRGEEVIPVPGGQSVNNHLVLVPQYKGGGPVSFILIVLCLGVTFSQHDYFIKWHYPSKK